jgi:multiple sugar transport system permease protein
VYNEYFFSFLMNDGTASSWATTIWTFKMVPLDMFPNAAAAASLIALVPVVFVLLLGHRYVFSWVEMLS